MGRNCAVGRSGWGGPSRGWWRCVLLGAAVLGVVCGCVLPPVTLGTIFLRPTEEMVGKPADYGYDYEEAYVPVAEGRVVCTWHVKAENAKGIVVVIPGSDRNKSRYLIGLPVFVPYGYDVILMDYEGFGDSTSGPPDLARLCEDGCAVVAHARTLHPNVIAFGVSTGGPTAVRAALEQDVAAVILEAPLVLEAQIELYLRAIGQVRESLWNLANIWVRPQIPPCFDIATTIAEVRAPKLILHSVDDDVVPFAAGLTLYALAPEPKALVPLSGGHGKMIEEDPDGYAATIVGWLDGVVGE